MTLPAFAYDPDRVTEWFTEWERTHASRWIVRDGRYLLRGARPKFIRGPRPLPESNESVKALRALEAQIAELSPKTETP